VVITVPPPLSRTAAGEVDRRDPSDVPNSALPPGELLLVFKRMRQTGLHTKLRSKETTMSDNTETAILAGGCFWGVQELLRARDGIISTRVGYTGGSNDHPTYRDHPGHAEAVEIVFDPERISYRDILEFFFQIHDPTTKDRQGNDIGSSYRSEIFALSDQQRQVARDTIADVDASGLWPGKVVTEISEAVPFWEAEAEHQDYLQKIPDGYTCHFPRPGWKLPHRETAA
jgi:peptide-methionine (S)-S-oxide reductase